MKINHEQAFGLYPHVYMSFRSGMPNFPAILNLAGNCVIGNGSGFGCDAVTSALGEYVERYHFYNEVDINLTDKLSVVNNPYVTESYYKLIAQLQVTSADMTEYAFDLSLVTSLFGDDYAYVPSVMVSLAQADSADRQFIPFIDSCGQAGHITPGLACKNALNEFLERQALIGSWLSGSARYQVAAEHHVGLSAESSILHNLSAHGELAIFEINNHLPGYAIIIFYFAHSTVDKVQYSVGMAADTSPALAMQRALNELWQSYIFMYLNADNPEKLDARYRYLNDLLQFNSRETRAIIPFYATTPTKLTMAEFMSRRTFTNTEIQYELMNISPHIFVYERSGYFLKRKYHFAKILSPDFFLHMGIMHPLNIDNVYARKLHISPDIKITNPIPFP